MKSMRERILEAFNANHHGERFNDFEEIRNKYDVVEILSTWLVYEGIIGYTRDIVDLLGECGVYIEE